MDTREKTGYTWREGDYEFIASRTTSYPPRAIPVAERWTLEGFGPWYVCRCFPMLRDCRLASKDLSGRLGLP